MNQANSSLPSRFIERFQTRFGVEQWYRFEEAMRRPPASSIRRHPTKTFAPSLRAVPWCSLGGYASVEGLFGADPLWHAGAYYVQEPASMFVAQYITQLSLAPQVTLDLCAAPGGKSTLLRSYIPEDSLLIANEIEGSRARTLLENLTRFGLDGTIVTSTSPSQLRASGLRADLILVDAPCSGEGMFRKEPKAIEEWSEENIQLCVERQRDILSHAWAMLNEGGHLIYSTCTYNREENEAQLEELQSKYPLKLQRLRIDPSWGIEELEDGVYHFMPHCTESEGLTIFCVQKIGHSSSDTIPLCNRSKRIKKSEQEQTPQALKEIARREDLYRHKEQWHALSFKGQELIAQLKGIKVLGAGVPLGETKGDTFIPHQAWACSAKLSPLVPFHRCSLDASTALQYLKREPLQINASKGMTLLMYREVPIGFAKQVQGRANNLYPKEWMIRNKTLTEADIPQWR